MAIDLATAPSGCFGESILRGGACMFGPASTSTTSSSKTTERSRHAVGRCAGSSRSPQPRPPLRGLSSRIAYASGSLSVSPRIDVSHSIFVASGTRRSWSEQRARTEDCPFPLVTLNSQRAFATQPLRLTRRKTVFELESFHKRPAPPIHEAGARVHVREARERLDQPADFVGAPAHRRDGPSRRSAKDRSISHEFARCLRCTGTGSRSGSSCPSGYDGHNMRTRAATRLRCRSTKFGTRSRDRCALSGRDSPRAEGRGAPAFNRRNALREGRCSPAACERRSRRRVGVRVRPGRDAASRS